ncbi:MAG TPA: GEVED domain-containing protein, partial [Thermoanaerobaculia bacterium]
MSSSRVPFQALRRLGWTVALLLCLAAGPAAAQPPTVNGWFHGDGDDARYQPYATSENGSVLYTYFHAAANRMYVALVVDHGVNDHVCSPKGNKAYTESAGWGPHRSCKRGSDSEFATFTLECAPGSPNSWSWQQPMGCAQAGGSPPSAWVSDSTCGPASPAADWPPGVETSSTTSWVANVNTYQAAAPGTRAWNLYAFGTDIDNGWKSPFVASAPNDVTQVPGYPTYSVTDGGGLFYEWEWSMVYEWSVDLGPAGADCGDQAIVFITGQSHHSPGKHDSEDDPFDPPPGDPTFSDWGDLPDSYGTTGASGGARHYIKVTGPRLGQEVQAEADGQPTSDATGDGSEEEGVQANVTGDWTPGATRSIDVTVSNAPSGALLGGWFDWNGDGDFDDAGEFFSWAVGNGTQTLSLTVGAGFDWQSDALFARFRVFSSAAAAPGGSLTQADSVGTATDGEVEDHVFAPGTLPVTLNAFATEGAPGGEVVARWQTASETDNVAFELWGLVAGEWRPVSGLIQARGGGTSALPQRYRARFEAPPGLTALQLVDYDSRGRAGRYGAFRLGRSYGEVQPVERIDWRGPRAERAERLRERGFADTGRGAGRWKKLRAGEPVRGPATRFHGASALAIDTRRRQPPWLPGGGPEDGTVRIETGPLTHVAVTEPGIQRVTYEALRDGGLDLAGVPAREIAVIWRGEPVARWIDGGPRFGPGSAIEFLGRPPSGDDALYIDAALYQVAVDRSLARGLRRLGKGKPPRRVSDSYLAEAWVDRPVLHHPQSPTGDPWVERNVLVRSGGPTVVTLDVPVPAPVADGPGRLVVGLGAITDLPDLLDAEGAPIPEHEVEVRFRPPGSDFVPVAASSASGNRDWTIEAELPAGLLQPGVSQVELRFSTRYLFSLVVVDRYGVRYPGPYRGPSLDFAPDGWMSGYRIEGFATPSVAVYAEGLGGALLRIDPRVTPSGGGYAVEIRQMAAERFWVTEAPHAPEVFTTEAPPDLLAGPADLVVIAGSGFAGTRALEDYAAQRAAFDPVVVDVEDVYNAVGFGMALPSAVTDYLAARDAVYPFTHVQLVGADCYDRRGYVSSCVSFVPLPTARVAVTRYSPSQNRLVDSDGDGVGDKAVGQFSVRTEAELATIVAKGSAWDVSGLSAGGSALLIAEEG